MIYDYGDKLLRRLKSYIRMEFNRVAVMGFDDLNVINVQKVTDEMYSRLMQKNEDTFLAQAEHCVKEIDGVLWTVTAVWVADFLKRYNKITGYLYYSEAERKRLRLNEQILTATTFNDRVQLQSYLRTAANLWYRQTAQYMLDVADEAIMETYEKSGVEQVKWVTEGDDKVCKYCAELDGKVFLLKDAPEKQHYNCRCLLVPVNNGE